ncbi:MFS transporter [Zooshikella sp. RANM57]|uniref:MFS transporter n=1 Tax=Zooshikella sp. RANM57 TaxID=3425863 RepID=UPI003D6DAEEA
MNENTSISSSWKQTTVLFLAAQFISLLGSSIVQHAIIWHIVINTSSGAMVAISTICGFLPQIAISFYAGPWLDRFDKKQVNMLSDGLIALATAMIFISFMLGFKSIWLLFLALIFRSLGTGIQTPAVNAIIPLMVPREHLVRVNGLLGSFNALTMLMSPVISAAIYAITALENILLIDISTAIIALIIMARLSIPSKSTKAISAQSNLQAFSQGLRYVKHRPQIARLFIFVAVVMVLISPSAFLTPLMVAQTFGDEPWRLAVSEVCFSGGAMLGGLLISFLGKQLPPLKVTLLATCGYGVLMIALGCSSLFFIYLIFNFIIGITMPCFNAPITSFLQENVDTDMQGRIFSLYHVVCSSALPLGIILFGPLADKISVQTTIILCGIIVAAVSIIANLKAPTPPEPQES